MDVHIPGFRSGVVCFEVVRVFVSQSANLGIFLSVPGARVRFGWVWVGRAVSGVGGDVVSGAPCGSDMHFPGGSAAQAADAEPAKEYSSGLYSSRHRFASPDLRHVPLQTAGRFPGGTSKRDAELPGVESVDAAAGNWSAIRERMGCASGSSSDGIAVVRDLRSGARWKRMDDPRRI